MRKLLRLNPLVVLLFLTSCSPSGWLGTTDYEIVPPIRRIAVAGTNDLWIITDRNELLKLSNQGDLIPSTFSSEPEVVFFLNEDEGWLYDQNRQVWSTVDGGENWTKRGSHPEFGIGASYIFFLDRKKGWLVLWFGVFTTTDGGDTWTMSYPTQEFDYQSLKAQPTCISVVDEKVAWLGFTSEVILRTIDGGTTWQRVKFRERGDRDTIHATADIRSIHASSEHEAWIGPGAGSVDGLHYTRDGGKTWVQLLADPIRTNFGQTAMSFTADKTGWIVGIEFARDTRSESRGVAFNTTDGKTWTRLTGETFATKFNEVKFADTLRGWLMGFDFRENRSYVYRTEDAGKTWRNVYELRRPKRP